MTKLKNSNRTKLKNSNCDTTQKRQSWQNIKTQMVTNSKTQTKIKLKNCNCEKKLKHSNCDQIQWLEWCHRGGSSESLSLESADSNAN